MEKMQWLHQSRESFENLNKHRSSTIESSIFIKNFIEFIKRESTLRFARTMDLSETVVAVGYYQTCWLMHSFGSVDLEKLMKTHEFNFRFNLLNLSRTSVLDSLQLERQWNRAESVCSIFSKKSSKIDFELRSLVERWLALMCTKNRI